MSDFDTSKAYDFIRPHLEEFREEWNKYASSGICDTEGRGACQDALVAKMRGTPFRVSFSRMEGYDNHKKDDKCPYTKREIGNNMARALTKLSKAFKKAHRKYGYTTSGWGKDYLSEYDFVYAIW
jgi:hypothetical protein